MVLGQHRRMWLEAMRQTEQRVYGFGSFKDGYALVGIHLRKQKCCLKKGTTSGWGKVFCLYQNHFHCKFCFFRTGIMFFRTSIIMFAT